MRVFVAGATGAIGSALIPELLRRGHEVFGSTRNLSKAAVITSMGAQPVGMNGLDQAEVLSAVRKVKPDAIVHQMTALAMQLFCAMAPCTGPVRRSAQVAILLKW